MHMLLLSESLPGSNLLGGNHTQRNRLSHYLGPADKRWMRSSEVIVSHLEVLLKVGTYFLLSRQIAWAFACWTQMRALHFLRHSNTSSA